MAEEMVTVTKKEYDSLLEDSAWLTALENAGVDNWAAMKWILQPTNFWKRKNNG